MLDAAAFAASRRDCELETRGRARATAATASGTTTAPCGSRPRRSARAGFEPRLALSGGGGRRERLQRARPRVRQPRERDDRHPHARRADRRRRPRARWSTSRSRSSTSRARRRDAARPALGHGRAPSASGSTALVRLEVDERPCIAYPRLTGEVEEGDVVLVNTQASELGLGSGGFDVLYANLTRGLRLPAEEGAHVMTLPYAPGSSRRASRRRTRRRDVGARAARRAPGRVPRAPQPARAGLRRARRATGRLRAAGGGLAARVALGHACGPSRRGGSWTRRSPSRRAWTGTSSASPSPPR